MTEKKDVTNQYNFNDIVKKLLASTELDLAELLNTKLSAVNTNKEDTEDKTNERLIAIIEKLFPVDARPTTLLEILTSLTGNKGKFFLEKDSGDAVVFNINHIDNADNQNEEYPHTISMTLHGDNTEIDIEATKCVNFLTLCQNLLLTLP